MIDRRGFLGAILAAAAAPAFVKAGTLMPLWVPKAPGPLLLYPQLGDMTAVVQAALDRAYEIGAKVMFMPGAYYVGQSVRLPSGAWVSGVGGPTIVNTNTKMEPTFVMDGNRPGRTTRIEGFVFTAPRWPTQKWIAPPHVKPLRSGFEAFIPSDAEIRHTTHGTYWSAPCGS